MGKVWWRRRVLLTIVAAVGILSINLVMPVKGVVQSQDSLAVPDSFRGKIVRQVQLSSANKAIALTFDDGPSPDITPQILSILKDNHVPATFFVLGRNLKKFPQIGQQILADGHTLGNHTWHHWYYQMREFIAAREIESTAKLISQVTGVRTTLFRPPYGHRYNGLVDYARKRKDVVILWSVDSEDWRGQDISVEELVEQVLTEAEPGAIVLMHDTGGDDNKIAQALPRIIDGLSDRGYTFVSIPQLLQLQAQVQ
ncbi:MAG: polysaccharide deacetylase family protein [Symploca sp. SIO2G7]|nr:polysaccharide deacetylase family protein [Symploca sp. SIO2G7]